MSLRVCTTPGCGALLPAGEVRCAACKRKLDRSRRADAKGKASNPYATKGHRSFRAAVLARDPRCVCVGECGQHVGMCGRPATVADHWPRERVELVSLGLNPNDPRCGRGLCARCHNAKTARTRNSLRDRVVDDANDDA